VPFFYLKDEDSSSSSSRRRAVRGALVFQSKDKDITHFLYLLDTTNRWTVLAYLSTALFWGTMFKTLVFRLIFKAGSRDLTKKPINIMIFIDELVRMVGFTCCILTLMLGTATGRPVVHYFGKGYCEAFNYLSTMSMIASATGGAGISLMRLLYVQLRTKTLKYRLGVYRVMMTLVVVFDGGALVMALFWVSAPQPTRVLPSFCYGLPVGLQHVVHDFSATASGGGGDGVDASSSSSPDFWSLVPEIIVGLVLLMSTAEMVMYGVLYNYLYQHDKSMRHLLTEKSIKTRHKRNAIAVTGHFIHFVCETLVTIITAASTYYNRDSTRFYAILVIVGQYGLNGVIQILLSAPLLQELSLMIPIRCINTILGWPLKLIDLLHNTKWRTE